MAGTSTIPPTLPAYNKLDTSLRLYEEKSNPWDNSGKTVLYSSPSAPYLRTSINQCFQVVPTSFTSSSIANAQQVQVRIPQGLITGIYESAFLQLSFQETGGVNSVTLAPAPYILSNQNGLQMSFNGSGSVIWQTSADALYASLQTLSQEKLTQALAFNQMNMSASTYASPTAIAAGGSAVYNIPLIGLPLIGLSAQTLKGDTILYLNFNNSGAVVAGTGTASLVGVKLVLTCHRNDYLDSKKNAKIANDVFINNVCLWNSLTYTTNLAVGLNQIQLAGLVEQNAGAMLVLIRQSKTTSGIYNFTSISGGTAPFAATIDLQSANGTSVLGSGAITEAFMRSTSQFLESEGIMSTVVPLNWIYLSARPSQFLKNADSSAGALPVGPNMVMQINCQGAFVAGAYIVDVWVLSKGSLRQIDGNMTLLK